MTSKTWISDFLCLVFITPNTDKRTWEIQLYVGWNLFWPTISIFNCSSSQGMKLAPISCNAVCINIILIGTILCIRVVNISRSTGSHCYTFISYDSLVEEELYWRTGLMKVPWPFTGLLLVVILTTFKVNAASIM